MTKTRNRKLLRPNSIAPWELRMGALRVFYEVLEIEANVVRVLAVVAKKAIAAVVSLEDTDLESLSLSLNPEFIAIVEQARQEFKAGKTLSLEEMKREVLP